ISLGDATTPSPARIAEIQGRVQDEDVACVLAEPQYNPGLVATVLEGTEANTGVIDPLGVNLEPGPTLYPQLIRNMATTLASSLSPTGNLQASSPYSGSIADKALDPVPD
ncbi:MAG: zinc ABC transporter substrate-binding protein, partial [Pseudomonadota bacterium]